MINKKIPNLHAFEDIEICDTKMWSGIYEFAEPRRNILTKVNMNYSIW